jgi:ANTAR domain-containing protein/GAF domain-containing protein
MAARVDERLAAVFVELADTLVAGYDLMEFLAALAERCVELLEVDAAGLLLADAGGVLRLVAASTEQARVLELFQLQEDEGPCVDCYRTGEVVVIGDAGSAQAAARWPRFAAAARQAGFAGVHAIPMRLRDQVIGTLNLFRAGAGGLDPAVARAARALVDVATIGILSERAVREREVLAGQLQVALNSRVVIEQAKGILAARLQVTPDQAFLVLRRYARDHNRRLTELAGDVIRGSAPITRPAPPPAPRGPRQQPGQLTGRQRRAFPVPGPRRRTEQNTAGDGGGTLVKTGLRVRRGPDVPRQKGAAFISGDRRPAHRPQRHRGLVGALAVCAVT